MAAYNPLTFSLLHFFENQWMVLMAEMLKLHFHAMGVCLHTNGSQQERGREGRVLKGKIPHETST
ncbi:unnamed protein product [Ilex paraguariensis]|uniref:Uncharacterized protein n=1 Tax=Ilex paraguariensis TaxID=185542 RepID=A0ABC8SJ33_9AQUA